MFLRKKHYHVHREDKRRQKNINNNKLAIRWGFLGGVVLELMIAAMSVAMQKKILTVCRKQSKSLSGACCYKKSLVFLKSTVNFVLENP